jgi:hypothetical protein
MRLLVGAGPQLQNNPHHTPPTHLATLKLFIQKKSHQKKERQTSCKKHPQLRRRDQKKQKKKKSKT